MKPTHRLITTMAILCALSTACIAFARPQMNWDMLAYVALVRGWEGATPRQAHADAYAQAEDLAKSRGVPERFATLKAPGHRATVAADAGVFGEQLPFYRSRPLYLAVVAVFGAAFGNVAAGCAALSVLSILLLCLSVLRFAAVRAGPLPAAILVTLLTLSPVMMDAAGSASPDAPVALMAAAAAMLFLAGRTIFAACILAAGVLARTDLAIFNLCLAAAWLVAAGWRAAWPTCALLASSAGLAKLADLAAGSYGYLALYHYTFLESYTDHPATLRGLPIPVAAYAGNLARGILYSLENGGLWMLLCGIGLCALLLRTRSPGFCLMLAVAAQTAIRYLLFPEIDLRFAAPGAAVLAVALVSAAPSPASAGRSRNSTTA